MPGKPGLESRKKPRLLLAASPAGCENCYAARKTGARALNFKPGRDLQRAQKEDCAAARRAEHGGHHPLHSMKLTLLLTALALVPLLHAEDEKKDTAPAQEAAKEEKTAEAPEESPTYELPRVSAGDIEGVKKLVGKKAIVYGKVISSKEVEKSGISFLDLDGGKFTVVCWKDSYSKFPDAQSPAKIYKGKTIEITGDITEYRKTPNSTPQPQIKLTGPAQIKVVEAAKEEGKDKKGGRNDEASKKDEAKPAPGKNPSR
jgi:hypothetical protein